MSLARRQIETPPAIPGATNTEAEGVESNNLREAGSVTTINDGTEDTDIATYMADTYPKIQPESPLYELYARDYGYTAVETKGNVINALYPERQAPGWSDDDEMCERDIPGDSLWRSVPSRLSLRQERGQRHAQDVVTFAYLSAYLMQQVSESSPCVNLTRTVYLRDKQKWNEWHSFRLTIGEATELAHLLLLLVDVATDTPDEIAGGA